MLAFAAGIFIRSQPQCKFCPISLFLHSRFMMIGGGGASVLAPTALPFNKLLSPPNEP
jgi:hypothetical protein